MALPHAVDAEAREWLGGERQQVVGQENVKQTLRAETPCEQIEATETQPIYKDVEGGAVFGTVSSWLLALFFGGKVSVFLVKKAKRRSFLGVSDTFLSFPHGFSHKSWLSIANY